MHAQRLPPLGTSLGLIARGGKDALAGVSARINAFGYAVLQFSAARPFQRPGRGWVYQFSLTPGF